MPKSIVFSDGFEVSVGQRVKAYLRDLRDLPADERGNRASASSRDYYWAVVTGFTESGWVFAKPEGISQATLNKYLSGGVCWLAGGDIARVDSRNQPLPRFKIAERFVAHDGDGAPLIKPTWGRAHNEYVTYAAALDTCLDYLTREEYAGWIDACCIIDDNTHEVIDEITREEAEAILAPPKLEHEWTLVSVLLDTGILFQDRKPGEPWVVGVHASCPPEAYPLGSVLGHADSWPEAQDIARKHLLFLYPQGLPGGWGKDSSGSWIPKVKP